MNQELELLHKIKQVKNEIKKSQSKYFINDKKKQLKKLNRELIYYRNHYYKETQNAKN